MIWLIARREFRTRALSKASLVTSSVMIVLIVVGALIAKPFLESDGDAETIQVASGPTAALAPYLQAVAAAQGTDVEVIEVVDPATDALDEGVAAVLTGAVTQPELFVDSADDAVVGLVQAAVQAAALDAQVEALGGDPAQVSQALAGSTAAVIVLGDADGFDSGEFFAGFVVILVLFFVLVQSASVIMMGVVEEKSSRVVEILLATVRPSTLLGGKVLGVGLYALMQAASLMLPLVFAAVYLDLLGSIGISVGALLLNFSVWFVLGFALFTVLFGGLAALVSRQEDLGSVTTPMMLLMMVPLYLAIYLVPNSPDGPVTAGLTQVPFFAPFLVPMRLAFDAISPLEVASAIVLCLIAIPLFVWLAGRIYAGAVLNTGGRMRIADALRRR
ncbi:ABC transporter permease [Demequina zhanjiangensis]|uniref:ABC transporter permease n=1 Tax=Demequina zhanjiangensis TaxID=3051659 RepID=A0ABT8FXZ4_9MICO|nr:ABC transporter permease [Demequina sp. SYSU T00b26]MDN4471564.1 ABC transporter permease [Demequina sp. SYSU T00b26]